MKKKITALYDGRAIHPDEPVPLPRDTRIVIMREAEEPRHDADNDVGATTFFDVARSLELCGPPDWSERVDYYMGHDHERLQRQSRPEARRLEERARLKSA